MALNETTQKLADVMKQHSTCEGGVVTSDKDIYGTMVAAVDPELTQEQIARVKKVDAAVVAGYTLGASQLSHAAMAKDSGLDKVVAKTNLGKDILQVTVLREETRPDPQNPGQTVTRQGVVKPNLKVFAGRGDVGQLAQVKQATRDLFSTLAD